MSERDEDHSEEQFFIEPGADGDGGARPERLVRKFGRLNQSKAIGR